MLARIKLDTKLQQKPNQKRKLKLEVIKLSNDIKQSIGSVLFNAIIYYLDKLIKLKASFIKEQHNKKLCTLLINDQLNNSDKTVKFIRHTVHNYSSLILLFQRGRKTLSFGLDEHIPTTRNRNKLFVEFETFYQNILKDIAHLPVDNITRLKTKLRHTCEKYSQIKVPYQYRTVIDNLRRNKNLAILKQDKGRGVVILDKNKNIEK